MNTRTATPSQTAGPFFSDCLLRDELNAIAGAATEGERIRVEGRVFDGERNPVPDALVELWQANSHGRYNHPADARDLPLDPTFSGWGRSGTDADGRFWFETVKPGAVPFDATTWQAPHLCLTVLARGLLNQLQTRLYFADDVGNETDPILRLVPAHRRHTLLAERANDGGTTVYRLDIVLQGEDETAFFNL